MLVYLEPDLHSIGPKRWNALLESSSTRTIFQTFEWHTAWLNQFRLDQHLFIVCAKEGDELVGLLPLVIVKKGKLRLLKFIGTGHSDYCDFLYPKDKLEVLEGMLDFIGTHHSEWDAMALDYIPQPSPTIVALNAFCNRTGLALDQYAKHVCPCIIFDPQKNYVHELLKKKTFHRHRNYFLKERGYQVDHFKTKDQIEPWLDRFFHQHIERWQHKSPHSLFLNEENRHFYKNLVKALAPRGWMVLTVVRSQDKDFSK